VSWYKEVKVFDSAYHALGWISTQDENGGPISMQVPLPRAYVLVATKAKAFGIHPGVSAVQDLAAANKKLQFLWLHD
jgi:hypothetical protein